MATCATTTTTMLMRTRMALYCVQGVSMQRGRSSSKVGHGTYFSFFFTKQGCIYVHGLLWRIIKIMVTISQKNISNFTPSKFLNLYKHFVFGRLVIPVANLVFWQATGSQIKLHFCTSAGLKPQSQLFYTYF